MEVYYLYLPRCWTVAHIVTEEAPCDVDGGEGYRGFSGRGLFTFVVMHLCLGRYFIVTRVYAGLLLT